MHHTQLINNLQVRLNKSPDNLQINEIIGGNSVKNIDSQKDARLKKHHFPNHVYGKYQFFDGNLKEDSLKDDERYLRR